MSPEDKRRLAFTSAALLAVALFLLLLSYIPTYLYILLFFAGSCGVGYYKAEEFRLFDRLGLNPRRGLSVPPALLRCLPGGSLRGAPASVRNKNRANKSDARNSLAASVERHFGSSVQRREAFGDTAISPRDLLMGSYLAKPESPHGVGRPVGPSGLQVHPGEQLRERLVRPNHGVPTPNRRLSFGDPVGTTGRFTITPQRHYPLQQTGTSSVGVLPPAQWDGFRKKNVLTQRNTPTHSPVTVKIARPDSASRSSFFDQINSPGALTSPGFGVQADPCSRETVLNVLRESRKRDVDDEDKGHATGQKSKRRRHDSSGSSHSAFEPLLANGAPSQLVPKPGSLKRGMNTSVLEESTMKRSRTSSISSVSGAPTSFGVPGSVRNPIRSSYSSSQGYAQRRAASSLSLSPLTSPASSRCQTPERAAKKPREEDITSPSSASSMKSDKTATDIVPGSGKRSPAPEATVSTISDSGGSSGKRKRKIQLVSTRRGDQISMPPPPELGYTVTVKDLDMEKKAALSQIQKVLEEPEPEKPAPSSAPAPVPTPSISLFSQVAPASSTAANPGVSAPSVAPLSAPAASTTISAPAPTPTIDLTVAPASTDSPAPTLISTAAVTTTTSSTPAAPAMSQSNPLLESLKNMRNNPLLSSPSPLAATAAAPATPVMAKTPASLAPTGLGSGVLKSEPALAPPRPSVSTSLAPATHSASSTPSAFAQILAQPLQPSSLTFTPPSGSTLFSLKPQTAPASAAPAPIPTPTASITPTVAVSSAANPAPSGFKPIFGAATTAPASAAEVKPTQPVFKPLFGSATEGGLSAFGQPTTTLSSAPASQSSTLLFGSLTNTQPAAASVASSTPATQTSSNSLFSGNWPSASAAPAPAVNSTFQFGAQAATTPSSGLGATTTNSSSSSTTSFQFGAVKPTQTAPAAATQSTFMFGQTPAAAQNSTTTTFGGFGLTNNTATTTASAPTTQATFGSSTFSTSTSFPNATTQAPAAAKPFTFGAGSGASAAAPFTFGAPASTAASSFGTQSQTTFGSTTAAPTFGTQSQPTFGVTTAAPSFGTQSQPTFGNTTATPSFGTTTQPTFGNASSGFSFANTTTPSVAPAFGAPTQTAAPVQAPAFTFGAAPATPQNNAQSAPAPAASGGFNFTASLSGAQFATPAPAAQTQGFPFGNNNADNKLAFGTSTPAFGNSSTPIPFGSPGTPVPGFTASPFTPSATFSIGAGSKPTGSRQRLQARRQHVRKK